jgi:UDP-N-acetylmuramyl tripeptide synthase
MKTASVFAGQALYADKHHQAVMPAQLSGMQRDSRLINAGDAFVVCGVPDQQMEHVGEARARGAALLLREAGKSPLEHAFNDCPSLLTSHARWSYARASARRHGADHLAFPLIGVTGTAGKSTITHHAWWMLGNGAARMGTIGFHDGVSERTNAQTTPPPEEMHRVTLVWYLPAWGTII